jgi:hypothetical protein
MKTAVEWLESEMLEHYSPFDNKLLYEAIHKAKEMEKNRIIEAHFNGCETGEMFNNEYRAFITDSEQYYNKTFKQQEQ